MDKLLDEELRSSLEILAQEKIQEGMDPREARRRARIELGGMEQVKMKVREARFGTALETVWQDVRYGLRKLRKNPGFTAVAVLTLALGIGANTAMFSVIDGVLLRPLPYRQPDRLAALWETVEKEGGAKWRVAPANFSDWREQNQAFEDVAAFYATSLNLTGAGEPELLRGVRATANYFTVLGVEPMLGRSFLPEEEVLGQDRVVLLGYGLWRSRFGSARDVISRTITLDGNSYNVIGVMPPGIYPAWPVASGRIIFDPSHQQFWIPFAFRPEWRNSRNSHFLGVLARLRSGVTLTQAQAQMDTLARRLEQEYPANEGEGILVSPLADEIVGNVRPALAILFGAVGLLLLLACANVANLLLERLAARQRETAIRAALGAGRGRTTRAFFVEGLLLALLAGALGIGLAYGGVDLLLKIVPQDVPRLTDVAVDLRVLGFTLALSFLTSLVFGLVPALQYSRPNLLDTLKEGTRVAGPDPRRQRFQNLLVVAQVGLAMMLVIAAGLLAKSFWRLQQVQPGFQSERVLVLDLVLPRSKYREWHQVKGFYGQLLDRLESLPGARLAAIAYDHPLDTNWIDAFAFENRAGEKPGEFHAEALRIVSPDYFRALGIDVLQGRGFTEQDVPGRPGVVLINESFAARYFPEEDPVGKRLRAPTPSLNWGDAVPQVFEIVGVVRDVTFNGIGAPTEPAFYVPAWQFPRQDMSVLVRTDGDPLSLVSAVRSAVWALDADQPISSIRTLESLVAANISQPRFNMFLMGLFGAVALLLALVGVYGLLSYAVARRTHEIGIRMALGASPRNILGMVLRQGLGLVLAGVGIGLAGAFALARFLESLLFGVAPTDPATFAAVAAVLAAVALLACYVPARRATKVDPMVALRYE